MGWVEQRGKKFRLSFRYGGKMFRHSLGVESQKEADESLSLVERNLRLLEEGILELPRGADLPLFLLSGGKLTAKPEIADVVTLGGLVSLYMGAHLGAQESNTIYTARIHANHLKTTLGDDFAVQNLAASDLQMHVERRAKAKGRGGKPLSPTTIKKEIASFSGIWSWATRMGHLTGAFPNKGLVYPKTAEKPPFQTRAEIEEQITRGGLTEEEKRELWNSLFLTLPEVAEFLEYVRLNARHDWIYPMFCFAAHTGARRSEILRSRIADFDFQAKSVLIREKKRVKGRRTTRRVPLSAFLAKVMREWFDAHPGGIYAISQPLKIFRSKKTRADFVPVTIDESNHHFNATIAGGKWEVIPGWHCFRHSFASNCAARGVDQRLINAWLGHQTEDMARRYAHLIPNIAKTALDSVFDE
jgi:integrase